jgi:hypothetical protein
MKMLLNTTLALSLLSAGLHLLRAQTSDFNLEAVAAKAKTKTEVTLEGPALDLALQHMPDNVKGQLGTLSRLVIRSYEFDKEGQYAESDLEGIHRIVTSGTGWAPILKVKEDRESTEIYVQNQGGRANGFLLISAEPKELTVIYVAGRVDLVQLKELVQSSIKYDLETAAKSIHQ